MKRIDLVFFDAGGGHRSAANALRQVIEQQHRPWNVRLVNLQEVLESLDFFRKVTGIRSEDVYNLLLKKGWTIGSTQMAVVMHAIIRMYHTRQVALLRKLWDADRPDLLVSLIPNFNRSLFQSLSESMPGSPMVTILTDLADYPPHFWIERQPQYFVCGTAKAAEQARSLGHPERRIFRSSGMILNPRFYESIHVDRATERRRLGLDPALPTALIMFGGHGSSAMADIAKALQASKLRLQMILICGHNHKLAHRLRAGEGRVPMHVEGFTREIPYFMHLSDFFIGKPGPGSISEALAMELPVIVEQNRWTLPQERYNTDWIREQGVGMVLESFDQIVPAVEELLSPPNYLRYRTGAANQKNRAVFEIPDMLEKLMTSHAAKTERVRIASVES